MAISESPISSTPISSSAPSAAAAVPGLPGIRSTRIQQPPPQILKGVTIRREALADPVALPVPRLRFISSQPPHPDQLKGGIIWRVVGQDPLALPVPRGRVIRPVYPNPDVLKGSILLRGAMIAEDPVALPTPRIRIVRPVYPPQNVLNGAVWRREALADPVALPVPQIRFVRPVYPTPDVLEGKVLWRGASIAEDPLNLPVPLIRIVRPVYPDGGALKGSVLSRGAMIAEDPVALPVPRIRFIRPVYPSPGILKGRFRRFPGQEPFLTFDIHEQPFVQNYRVADDDFSRFELYVGEDQLPDLTTEPILVSQTLPFSLPITPPVSGTKTIFVVLRERDEHGVISANQQTTIFVIDSSGALEFVPPGPAVQLQLFPDAIGKVLVFLRYNKAADGLNPADTWEVFASEGVDPNPTVDVPVHTSTIIDFGELAYLRTVIESFTPGATLHVIGSVFRSSDGKRGVTLVEQIVLPLAPSIDEDKTTTFGGEVHEIR